MTCIVWCSNTSKGKRFRIDDVDDDVNKNNEGEILMTIMPTRDDDDDEDIYIKDDVMNYDINSYDVIMTIEDNGNGEYDNYKEISEYFNMDAFLCMRDIILA